MPGCYLSVSTSVCTLTTHHASPAGYMERGLNGQETFAASSQLRKELIFSLLCPPSQMFAGAVCKQRPLLSQCTGEDPASGSHLFHLGQSAISPSMQKSQPLQSPQAQHICGPSTTTDVMMGTSKHNAAQPLSHTVAVARMVTPRAVAPASQAKIVDTVLSIVLWSHSCHQERQHNRI